MVGESGITRGIIDKLDSSDTEGDILEAESGVTTSIIVELNSSDIEGDQLEG